MTARWFDPEPAPRDVRGIEFCARCHFLLPESVGHSRNVCDAWLEASRDYEPGEHVWLGGLP